MPEPKMEGAFPGASPALQAPLWLIPGLLSGLAACNALYCPPPAPTVHAGVQLPCPLAIYSPSLCAFCELAGVDDHPTDFRNCLTILSRRMLVLLEQID